MKISRLIQILQSIEQEQGGEIDVFIPSKAAPYTPLAEVRQQPGTIGNTLHLVSGSEEAQEYWAGLRGRKYGEQSFIVAREYQEIA